MEGFISFSRDANLQGYLGNCEYGRGDRLHQPKKLFNVVPSNVLGFLKGKELKMLISDLKITASWLHWPFGVENCFPIENGNP